MTKLANTDNSQYSAHFGSSNVPGCPLKGGRRKRKASKKTKRRAKKTKKRNTLRRKLRRKLRGGSYTLAPDIKMGPIGHLVPSDSNPDLSLISNKGVSTEGDLKNLNGQAGGKRKRRVNKTKKSKKSKKSRKSRRKRRMKGGAPVAFGYGIGKFTSLAEANPPPIETYNSCQKDNYVH